MRELPLGYSIVIIERHPDGSIAYELWADDGATLVGVGLVFDEANLHEGAAITAKAHMGVVRDNTPPS